MSDFETKARRSKRLQKSKNRGIKRFKDAKLAPIGEPLEYTHRFEDRSWFTCGNSNCVMCGNPRKFWSERTLKEKSDVEIEALEKRAQVLLDMFEHVDPDITIGCDGISSKRG